MLIIRNLESCSGNDALIASPECARTSLTLAQRLAGSDFVFRGFGSSSLRHISAERTSNAYDIGLPSWPCSWTGIERRLSCLSTVRLRLAAPRGR